MSTVTAPKQTLQQRLDALERANDVRHRRSVLKREMKAGAMPLVPTLLDPPDYAATMKTFDLLLAAPKIGRVKATRTLRVCGVSPSKTLGGMSERQRRQIAATLIGRG